MPLFGYRLLLFSLPFQSSMGLTASASSMAPTNIKPSVTILPAAVATGLSLRYTPPKGGGGGVQYQDGLDPKYQPYVDLALEAIYEGLGIEKPKATETSGVTVVNYQIERAADQGDEELGGEDESEGTEEDG